MAVTHQPGRFQMHGSTQAEFETYLFDCCDDCGVCWMTVCCPCIMGCSIASDMDECCMCGLGMPIRSVYRTRYNIKGSMCEDFMVSYFCSCCATCQLKRDIKHRKKNNTL